MEKILALLLIVSGALRAQATEWKVTESDPCGEKLIVKANEGESFVTVQKGTEEIKLFGKDGAVFHEESLSQTEFASTGSAKYKLIIPGYVDGNPPKIDFIHESKSKRCRLEFTR